MPRIGSAPTAPPCSPRFVDPLPVPAASALERYYRWHARFYDATRWLFLFGRGDFASLDGEPGRILEIGCGTGRNLVALAERFPQACLTGLDLSADMLDVARAKTARYGARIRLVHGAYHAPLGGGHDLIVLSYCLSMVNPGFLEMLTACRDDLASGGRLYLVDFLDSPVPGFRRWMALNHVRMDGHLPPALTAAGFRTLDFRVHQAFAGLWRWFSCVAAPPA